MLKIYFSLCLLAAFCLPRTVAAGHGDSGPYAGSAEYRAGRCSVLKRGEWGERLSADQQNRARRIIEEARPRIRNLRGLIREKMAELESLNYNHQTSPDTLSRLGCELQQLRDTLREMLLRVDDRMCQEVGVSLGRPASRGCSMEHASMLFGDGQQKK